MNRPSPRSVVIGGLLVLLGLVASGCDGPPPTVAELRGATGPTAEITALAYSPDGRTLATRGADAIRVWDADALRVRATLPVDGSPAGGLVISPDGRTLAAPLAGRGVVAWDLATGQEAGTFPAQPPPAAAPDSVAQFGAGAAFSPDGATLAGPGVGPDVPALALYDRATRDSTGLGPPGPPMTQLAFTPDGRTLVAKGIEGKIRTWDVAARAERRTIAANASYLTALAVSPDGQLVATSGSDRYLRSYRIDDGADAGKFKGHLKAILGIAYHPSGRYVATGDAGGVLYLWEVATGRAVAQFVGHEGKVWALAFRPDGRELASGGQDRRLRIWSIDQALKTRAADR